MTFVFKIQKSGWLPVMAVLLLFFNSCRSIQMYSVQHPSLSRLRHLGQFPPILAETSGLQVYGDSMITFNDSGGEPGIYIFSPELPLKPDFFPIQGTNNVDWEDITSDSLYIYIGDIGNNFGSRDTLIIYRIKISELKEREVYPEIISFTFLEMNSTHRNRWNNPFDCEAMAIINDSIWLFTKNWEDESSWIYKLPKIPGHYNLKVQSALFPKMLVTGADFSFENNLLLLIGYHRYMPRIRGYRFENNMLKDYFLVRNSKLAGIQTEGIAIDNHRVYFSNEKSFRKQGIFSFELDTSF